MLETIALVLVILWLLGMVGVSLGTLLYGLVVAAVVVVLVRFLQGRRPD